MKLKRWIPLLFAIVLLLSLLGMSVQAAGSTRRVERKRDNYTHYTTEELMSMLKMDETQFKTLRELIREAILGNQDCYLGDLSFPSSDTDARTALQYLIYRDPEYSIMIDRYYNWSSGGQVYMLEFLYKDGYEKKLSAFCKFSTA